MIGAAASVGRFGVLAVACGLGLAALPMVPVRADDAEEAFRQACGSCHRDAGALARRNPGRTAGSRGDRWDTFLRAHHAPDPVQRTLIIAYLERSR